MSPVLHSPATLDRWDTIHRFCDDDPGEIDSFDEARRVLTVHAGHACQQFMRAFMRTSTPMSA